MGYTTDFEGRFALNRPLAPEHHAYLKAFNNTRRMMRHEKAAASMSDTIREAAGLPVGHQGGYFVGGGGFMGQDRDESVAKPNQPPDGQPGLWCKWTPSEDGHAIEWDGGEKFYDYVDWLKYIIQYFLAPWGYSLTGEVLFQGEDIHDRGTIVVVENEVSVKKLR